MGSKRDSEIVRFLAALERLPESERAALIRSYIVMQMDGASISISIDLPAIPLEPPEQGKVGRN